MKTTKPPVRCPIHRCFPRWKFPQDEDRGELQCLQANCPIEAQAWNYQTAVRDWNEKCRRHRFIRRTRLAAYYVLITAIAFMVMYIVAIIINALNGR